MERLLLDGNSPFLVPPGNNGTVKLFRWFQGPTSETDGTGWACGRHWLMDGNQPYQKDNQFSYTFFGGSSKIDRFLCMIQNSAN